jgi:hypothetical protein
MSALSGRAASGPNAPGSACVLTGHENEPAVLLIPKCVSGRKGKRHSSSTSAIVLNSAGYSTLSRMQAPASVPVAGGDMKSGYELMYE